VKVANNLEEQWMIIIGKSKPKKHKKTLINRIKEWKQSRKKKTEYVDKGWHY